MQTDVEIPQPEPALSAPGRGGRERVPGLARPPPAAFLVVQVGKRVENRVEVRRDMEAEHLDVVADVADHGELTGREGGLEAAREAGPADTPGEKGDLHWT